MKINSIRKRKIINLKQILSLPNGNTVPKNESKAGGPDPDRICFFSPRRTKKFTPISHATILPSPSNYRNGSELNLYLTNIPIRDIYHPPRVALSSFRGSISPGEIIPIFSNVESST